MRVPTLHLERVLDREFSREARPMLNKIFLIGRLAQDPDLRYTPTGVPVARFSLAVERPFKKQDGTRDADFIDIVAWRQRAEFASNYLAKGKQILVEGRLQIRSFVGQDGVRRRVSEVQVENFSFVGPPSGEKAAEVPPQENHPFPPPQEDFGGPQEAEPPSESGDPFSQC
jgi:single-strand DNA-binding protein